MRLGNSLLLMVSQGIPPVIRPKLAQDKGGKNEFTRCTIERKNRPVLW